MKKRTWLVAAAVLVGLGVGGVLLFQVAVRRVQDGIVQSLGPRASVGALKVGWSGVELTDLHVRAEPGRWPAEDELRATRVMVVPQLRSLLGGDWRVSSVRIEGAYVSVLRSREGKVKLLPALFERTAAVPPEQAASAEEKSGSSVPVIHVGEIELVGAVAEFYDASVRRQPHRIRLEQIDATVRNLKLPALDEAIGVDVRAVVKGPQHDGELAVAGDITPASRDAHIKGQLGGVDLIALQPYLLRLNEGGVKRGTLDLSFEATVQKNHLHAPGTIALVGLELGSGGGVLGTFAGVPRQAVIAAMSRKGQIELQFTLDGRLDDPKFSLNEAFAMRTAAGLAETLGVSLGGVVEGVGNVIKGLFGR